MTYKMFNGTRNIQWHTEHPMAHGLWNGIRNVEHPSAATYICRHTYLSAHTSVDTHLYRHTSLSAHISVGTHLCWQSSLLAVIFVSPILLGLGSTFTRTPHQTTGLSPILGLTATIAVSTGVAIGCWLRHRVLPHPFAVKLDPGTTVKTV